MIQVWKTGALELRLWQLLQRGMQNPCCTQVALFLDGWAWDSLSGSRTVPAETTYPLLGKKEPSLAPNCTCGCPAECWYLKQPHGEDVFLQFISTCSEYSSGLRLVSFFLTLHFWCAFLSSIWTTGLACSTLVYALTYFISVIFV